MQMHRVLPYIIGIGVVVGIIITVPIYGGFSNADSLSILGEKEVIFFDQSDNELKYPLEGILYAYRGKQVELNRQIISASIEKVGNNYRVYSVPQFDQYNGYFYEIEYRVDTIQDYDLLDKQVNKIPFIQEALADIVFNDSYGRFIEGSANWADVRSDSTANALVTNSNTSLIVGQRYSPYGSTDFQIDRDGLIFDTTAISGTVSSVDLYIYGLAISDTESTNKCDFDVVSFTPADPDSLVTTDYAIVNWGSTLYGVEIARDDFNTGSYNSISFEATGISAIQTFLDDTEKTVLGLRCSNDIDNLEPTGENGLEFYTYLETGIDKDPYIEITLESEETPTPAPLAVSASTSLVITCTDTASGSVCYIADFAYTTLPNFFIITLLIVIIFIMIFMSRNLWKSQ